MNLNNEYRVGSVLFFFCFYIETYFLVLSIDCIHRVYFLTMRLLPLYMNHNCIVYLFLG